METGYARLTVRFEEPFWVLLCERGGGGTYAACKHTFGAEPGEQEVYAFLLENWRDLKFSPPAAAEGPPERKVNPKRARREARRAVRPAAPGTRGCLQTPKTLSWDILFRHAALLRLEIRQDSRTEAPCLTKKSAPILLSGNLKTPSKAQRAIALQREEGKAARARRSRAEREAEEARKFALRQEKRREKRKGH